MTTWDLCWIGCGALKAPTPKPAIDLYLGPIVRAHRMIVEHLGRPVDAILSAQHAVLPATQLTNPYECRLTKSSQRQVWSARVLDTLLQLPTKPKRLLVLAGAPYIDGWVLQARTSGIEVEDPLRGMELGARRNFAKRFVMETPQSPAEPREALLDFVDHFRKAGGSSAA